MDYYTNNSAQPQRKAGRLIVVIVLVLLAIGGAFFYTMHSQTKKDVAKQDEITVAEQFTKAMLGNDSDTSYNLLTNRGKKSVGTKEEWAKQIAQVQGQSSFTREGSQLVQNPEATYGKGAKPVRITYTIKTADGHTYGYYVIVTSDSGTLKVDEFNSYQK